MWLELYWLFDSWAPQILNINYLSLNTCRGQYDCATNFATLITLGLCPSSHPNAYFNGKYCCASKKEKMYAPQGEECDGSLISYSSECCEEDQYIICRYLNCKSEELKAGKDDLSNKCPLTHPNVYYNGQYCCASNREKYYEPQGGMCDGSLISYSSMCCEEDQYTSCPQKHCLPVNAESGSDFADDMLEKLEKEITKKIRKLKLGQIKEYLQSDESLIVFQWQLLTDLKEKGRPVDLEDETISWILNDHDALETLLTSGDVEDNKWKEAVEIVAEIIRQDQNAKQGLKLRLAIAVGLTFSTDVFSMAHGGTIDGIARYHSYAQWADEKLLLEPFYTLNAWQMRYVVGSWAEDDELIWARNNALEDFRDPDKIGSVTHSMVEYNLYNDDGISVQTSGYYYGKPVTLEWIHTIGGVCGAISKFGAGMAQAFGIPGLPVGQPGHCAFIWLKNGTNWYLGNDISGWAESTTHSGIQYSWKSQAPFFPVMNEAQLNPDTYRLSEKMRIIAAAFSDSKYRFTILEDATTICPQNYDLWYDMSGALSEGTVDKKLLENTLSPILLEYEENSREIKDVAKGKEVTASEYQNLAYYVAKDGGEWCSDNTVAWVEIDLGGPCSINELQIHWWGTSYSNDYDLLAEVDGEFVLVRTKDDENRDESYYNPWGVLQGWDKLTSKVRVDMRNGNIDPWYGKYYFGIRQMIITGVEHGNKNVVSLNKQIKTNKPSAGQELIDGDISTYWTSEESSSWIKIDLEGLCVIDHVIFEWLDNIQGRQKIQYLVGGKSKLQKKGKFNNIHLPGIAGQLSIKLQKSVTYSIREITAVGSCYSARDILKIKVNMGFNKPDASYNLYVIGDISGIIEQLEIGM